MSPSALRRAWAAAALAMVVACESQSPTTAGEELASCRRRVEDTKVDEIFYSMEVAKCMETRGFKLIDQAKGLLNADNWRKK